MFKVALQESEYSVNIFTNPIVALEHILNNPIKYELVITDYRMPMLNGCEFGAKVKELNANIKVILISAYDIIEEDYNKLKFDFLRKPFPLQKLLDMINVSLNNNAKTNPYQRGLDDT